MSLVQSTFDGFDLPVEGSSSIVPAPRDQIAERGAIFTKREVVDFMLDLAGYRVEEDLTQAMLLEPSFGQGDFLFVVVERLLDSFIKHHKSLLNIVVILRNTIRAVEVHQDTFLSVRRRLLLLLQERGIAQEQAIELIDIWLIHDDFLLTEFSQRFTHIIGNPPYVRQELLPDALLARYRALYRTIYDRADLYIPFIERSLSLLTSTGTLSFICSDRWMKNRYGGPLRAFISNGFHLRVYIDMTGTESFQSNVTAYAAVTVMTPQKGTQTSIVHHPRLDAAYLHELAIRLSSESKASADPSILVLTNVVKHANPWILSASSDEQKLLEKLEKDFHLIEAIGCKVGIGVATGCDAVFIRPQEELAREIEEDRLLPLAMTDDIRSGRITWSGKVIVNPFDHHGRLVDLESYPYLKAYFLTHEKRLKNRYVAKKNPGTWYRTIDKISGPLTCQPKLLIPDIKGVPHVVYDEGHYYPHHNLYVVTSSTWDLHALQAVLQSSIAKFFVAHYSIKMRGGYLRFQAQNIRRICLPRWDQISEVQRKQLREVALQPDIRRCNELVFDLYHLTESERMLLREADKE